MPGVSNKQRHRAIFIQPDASAPLSTAADKDNRWATRGTPITGTDQLEWNDTQRKLDSD